jgi:hypothetical protein
MQEHLHDTQDFPTLADKEFLKQALWSFHDGSSKTKQMRRFFVLADFSSCFHSFHLFRSLLARIMSIFIIRLSCRMFPTYF